MQGIRESQCFLSMLTNQRKLVFGSLLSSAMNFLLPVALIRSRFYGKKYYPMVLSKSKNFRYWSDKQIILELLDKQKHRNCLDDESLFNLIRSSNTYLTDIQLTTRIINRSRNMNSKPKYLIQYKRTLWLIALGLALAVCFWILNILFAKISYYSH